MIVFNCPECGEALESPDSLVGQDETCPMCGNITVVPASSAAPPPLPAPLSPPPVPPPSLVPPPVPFSAGGAPPVDRIGQVLQSYLPQNGLYVAPNIPQKKLANACRTCEVPSTERVLALIDCTVFGSAKNALVFGSQAVYFHNGSTCKCRKGIIPYTELHGRIFHDGGSQGVHLGSENQVLDLSGSMCSKKMTISLLQAVAQVLGGQAPGRVSDSALATTGPAGSLLANAGVHNEAATHLPAVQFRALGAACWSTGGTKAGRVGRTLFMNVAANAILLPLGLGMFGVAAKKLRAGLIGVTDDTLYVLDMGTVSGDGLTLSVLREMGNPTVSTYALSTVQATHSMAAGDAVLQLHGAIAITATFSESCGCGNSGAAAAIANAIQSPRR